MDRRNGPTEAWGQAMGFWFRLWQAQLDQSLKIWCLWAQALPRTSAAELAAEAEAMRHAAQPGHARARKPAVRAEAKAQLKTGAKPAAAKPASTLH